MLEVGMDSPGTLQAWCVPHTLLSMQDSRVLSGQSRPGAAHASSVPPGGRGDGAHWHRGRQLAWGGDQASWQAPRRCPPAPDVTRSPGLRLTQTPSAGKGLRPAGLLPGTWQEGVCCWRAFRCCTRSLWTHASSVALGLLSPSLSFSRCKGNGVCWVVGQRGLLLGTDT